MWRCVPLADAWYLWIQVLAATGVQGMLEKLVDSNALLDKINKGLNAYLEKKRLFFPRCVYIP